MSDIELEYIKLRKLQELRNKHKNIVTSAENRRDPHAIVKKKLVGRGEEILNVAYSQYPQITKNIVERIAELIERDRIDEPITGELLYELFYSLGLPIRLETKIIFKEHGKAKSLAEKLEENI